MAKRRRIDPEQDPEASPVPEVEPVVPSRVPVSAPAPATAPAPAPAQPQVRIRNLSDRLVECSVLNEDGQRVSVRLMARGVSVPYPASQIDQYTCNLADRGILKVEPVR